MAENDAKNSPSEPFSADPQAFETIRRSRNRVLGLGLAAFVVLVFFISIAKMS
ncbi:hypothetical protein MTR62_10745 [Novosphingobium sp. 1949]|uniref:Uncharacterized protein n=1 Tax=Novosphingobium organovorum TaxID=2930092 RepID=A0ABT0BEF0_9SPHN|nr:hypothetical protein [Novosphingobium organovorum]MCJ2183166.1 hypothetical protein [Novosphingobium organovorum]